MHHISYYRLHVFQREWHLELVPFFFHFSFRCQKGGCINVCEGGSEHFVAFFASSPITRKENELPPMGQSSPALPLCCFKLFPPDSCFLFFISFTKIGLVLNVTGPIGCTEILVQCLEEMRSRSRSALSWKSKNSGHPGKENKTILPSRQEGRNFEALPGLQIPEDCRIVEKSFEFATVLGNKLQNEGVALTPFLLCMVGLVRFWVILE